MSDTPLLIDQFAVAEGAYNALVEALEGAQDACAKVASIVRPVRKRVGWSQADLAKHVSMPVGRVIAVEGGAIPSLDDAVVLLRWIGAYAPIQPELPFQHSATSVALED